MEDRSARYRIGQLAARTGVDPQLLRKWEARYGLLEPKRSRGGFRIYSLEDEQRVRLMQRHLSRGYAAAEPAELARQGIVAPSPAKLRGRLNDAVVERSTGLFREALVDYDEGAAQRALDDLFAAYSVDAVLRDALLPFMRDLGDQWEGGRLTPGQEHFASTIVEGRLLALGRGWGSGAGPRALLACPERERHTLGLIAFGITLSRRGWRVTYLGADTPADSIGSAAAKTEPSVVALSASQPRYFADASERLSPVAQSYRTVIGGRGATAAVAKRLGARRLATDPVTAATRLTRA